jgi:dihydroorotase
MNRVLIKNAKIVNEGVIFEGDVLIENDLLRFQKA